jgi:hypothetical protein
MIGIMKRIDIFMPPPCEYGTLAYYTKELNKAFLRAGIESRILVSERNDPKPFLESLFGNPPDCTLSFNGLLPDKEGRFLCDLIKIPHVALLTESPYEFLALTKSNRNIIGCPDLGFGAFISGLNFQNVVSFPLAVGSNMEPLKKSIDVAFFGTCVDYKEIEGKWKKSYAKELVEVLNLTVQASLKNPDRQIVHLFVEMINQSKGKNIGVDPHKMDLISLLYDIEQVVRGKERVDLLMAIESVQVDLYGAGPWDTYLKGKKNIRIHGPIPFEEALTVMKKTKITLNSSPHFKQGIHERILASLACGSVPMTGKTAFLLKEFGNEKGSLYFEYGKWDALNKTLQTYLKDQGKLDAICKTGRSTVQTKHTFDAQVKDLVTQISPLLEKAKSGSRAA